MRPYPEEIQQFIAENVAGTPTKILAEMVNKQFGTSFARGQMRSYLKNHGLKTGIGRGIPAGTPTNLYPAEVREFIRNNHVGVGHQGMADLLNQTFGTNYTKGQMKAIYSRFKLNSGRTGRFPKGHTPTNKGCKGIHVSPETEFKKGNKPRNQMAVGSEILRTDGYVYVKIAEPNKWRQKHVLIWEAANGPKPEGHRILFGDGNRLNFELDNLVLATPAQMARLNQNHLIRNDAELTKTGIVIADIINKIGELKRRKNHH